MDEHRKYLIISYCTCVFALVAFALYAVLQYTYRLVTSKHDQSTEQFITARGSAGKWRIAWSFFATAVGAWCITGPPSFAVYTGIVGCAMYAIACGLPVLVIALFGAKVQDMHPDCVSLGDFIGKRFGPVFKTFVVCLVLINMAIVMLAEYTTIGALFQDYVGSVNYPIVITVGVLTMVYTAYGGLYISMLTDQAQAILSILLIAVLSIYVAVTFREPVEKPLPEWLGPNKYGYSAIFSMPCSLLAATVFSEAVWQKVWASESKHALIFGGSVAFVAVTIAVFLFGFGGWLAAWGGLIDFELTNPNLYLFQVFAAETGNSDVVGASAQVGSWVGVLTLILAVTMNESAIDSLQTGITSSIAGHWLRDQHVVWARLIVVCINVPLIVVSLQDYTVLQLFLITNMATTCCFIPVMLGIWDWTHQFVTETAAFFGCAVAFLTCTAYGIGRHWNNPEIDNPIQYGAWYTWYGNANYDWDYFLVASGFSFIGVLMWAVPQQILQRFFGVQGPGISGVLKYIPGFKVITGEGLGVDLLSLPCFAWLAKLLGHDPALAAAAREASGKIGRSGSSSSAGAATAAKPISDVDVQLMGVAAEEGHVTVVNKV